MTKTINQAVKEIQALVDSEEEILIGDGQVDKILEGVDPSTYVMEEAGSFDSTVYDLNAWALAYINEDGKIALVTWEEEMY